MLSTWLGGKESTCPCRMWVSSLGDPLEKEVAIHSVFLPGKSHGQQSLVGHKRVDLLMK